MVNKKICRMLILACCSILFWGTGITASAQREKRADGNFDIRKVQEAIRQNPGDSLMAETGAIAGRREENSDSVAVIVLRIVGYLVVLSLLIILVVWVLKRFGVSGASRAGSGTMDMLESLPIGQNRFIILVRVMDSILVLSHTAHTVTLLDKIEGEKAVELIASTKGGTSIVRFKDVFNSFVGKMKKSS